MEQNLTDYFLLFEKNLIKLKNCKKSEKHICLVCSYFLATEHFWNIFINFGKIRNF